MHAPTGIPKEHQLLPDVTLMSSGGRPIRTSDYRGQCPLVLVFIGSPTGEDISSVLDRFAEQYAAFREWTAEVLAVVLGTLREAIHGKSPESLPFPVLADVDGRVHRAFGAVTPEGKPAAAIYITDRWGEIYVAGRTSAGQALPTPHEILGWLHFIAIQCPECGVADWPAREE
jgi:peroxiredoxin